MKSIPTTKRIFLLSVLLLVVSFMMPTYCTHGDDCGSFGSGFLAFFFGIASLLVGGAYLCWFANPFLIIAWFFIKRKPIIAILSSAIALTIGLLFMTYDEIVINEAGHSAAITGYNIGYWFWLSSMAAVFLGSLWYLITHNRNTT